jgi:import receptor subunit TOM22
MTGTLTAVLLPLTPRTTLLLIHTDSSIVDSDVSDTSSIASDDLAHESLYERLTALQDILPPAQRKFITRTIDTTSSWVKTGLTFSGKALWVVSTSALLLGVPWALAYAEEQQMVEMEREMKMQQSANEVSLHVLDDEKQVRC